MLHFRFLTFSHPVHARSLYSSIFSVVLFTEPWSLDKGDTKAGGELFRGKDSLELLSMPASFFTLIVPLFKLESKQYAAVRETFDSVYVHTGGGGPSLTLPPLIKEISRWKTFATIQVDKRTPPPWIKTGFEIKLGATGLDTKLAVSRRFKLPSRNKEVGDTKRLRPLRRSKTRAPSPWEIVY